MFMLYILPRRQKRFNNELFEWLAVSTVLPIFGLQNYELFLNKQIKAI